MPVQNQEAHAKHTLPMASMSGPFGGEEIGLRSHSSTTQCLRARTGCLPTSCQQSQLRRDEIVRVVRARGLIAEVAKDLDTWPLA